MRELIAGRDWLFADDFYHIDLSHLNSVVQMATQLEKCAELELARELCAYGMKLSPRFRYQSEPPFEDQYADYDKYPGDPDGRRCRRGRGAFPRQDRDASDPQTAGTFPTEIFVNLLMRLGRDRKRWRSCAKYLAPLGEVRLSCPNLVELVPADEALRRAGGGGAEQGNAVNFLAGLIAGRKA